MPVADWLARVCGAAIGLPSGWLRHRRLSIYRAIRPLIYCCPAILSVQMESEKHLSCMSRPCDGRVVPALTGSHHAVDTLRIFHRKERWDAIPVVSNGNTRG